MDKRASAEEASKGLSCQTWVLKVSIHCLGCKGKVKKVLQAIDGVYATSIDSQHHRVTVIGNIEVQTLIKKLRKAGKPAEIWPEKVGTREREGTATQNNHKPKDPNGKQNGNDILSKSTIGFNGKNPNEETENGGDPPEESTSRMKFPAVINKDRKGEDVDVRTGGKNKKKGKFCDQGYYSSSATPAGNGLQNHILGMDHIGSPSDLAPTRQLSIPFPHEFSIPRVCASSYGIAHLSESHGPLYGVQPSPYTDANGHQVPHLDSLNIFSDENVDGCSIM